jgi:hypothetical protein
VLPTDGERFNRLITGMSRMYGSDPDQLVLDAYWIALRSWEFEDLQRAAAHLMQTSKFMPRPADFNELRKAGQPTSGEVFAGIRQWLKYGAYGYTLQPNTPPKIATAIRAIGGPDEIAMCEVDKLHFLEKRFTEHYDQISDRQEIRDAVPEIASSEGLKKLADRLKALNGHSAETET